MAMVQAQRETSSSQSLAGHDPHIRHILHVIAAEGWQDRLQPLAAYLGARRLVGTARKPGAAVRYRDVGAYVIRSDD